MANDKQTIRPKKKKPPMKPRKKEAEGVGKVKDEVEVEATAECVCVSQRGYVAVMRYHRSERIPRRRREEGGYHEILPLNKNLFSQRTLEI